MKLIYIVNARIPTEKAHGVQIMQSCEAFASAGNKLELWVPDRETAIGQDPFDFYGVQMNFSIRKIQSFDAFRVEKYIGSLSFWLQSVLFLMKLFFLRVPYDTLVYTRNVDIAWLFARKGNRVAYEAHQWPESKIWLYKRFLRRVGYIICNSRGTEAEFRKQGFDNTLVAPNGVDLEKFNAESSEGEIVETKRRLGIPEDKNIVLYTGHLYGWKGVDVIIGMARALVSDPQILFVLVGGTKKDVQQYQTLIEKEGLSNVMICGHKIQSEIPRYLACADVLLLPNIPVSEESERYTSPIKMFEYMASKKPIVASDMPSLREILNVENAVLVPPSDVSGFVNAVRKVLEDAQYAGSITKRAFSDVQNHTWEKRAERILYFLEPA